MLQATFIIVSEFSHDFACLSSAVDSAMFANKLRSSEQLITGHQRFYWQNYQAMGIAWICGQQV